MTDLAKKDEHLKETMEYLKKHIGGGSLGETGAAIVYTAVSNLNLRDYHN